MGYIAGQYEALYDFLILGIRCKILLYHTLVIYASLERVELILIHRILRTLRRSPHTSSSKHTRNVAEHPCQDVNIGS